MVRIASAQYNISFLQGWHDYEEKINRWVEEAVAEQADLLLFPEYASMELTSLFPERVYSSLSGQLKSLQSLLTDYLQLYRGLARKYQVYILAGTFPVDISSARYRNRAWFFSPEGDIDFQDKLMMTRFENEQWLIEAGERLKVISTRFGRLGINICYDCEFPNYARKLAEQGALLILVPSCTDTAAGYHRVRLSCQARALENQCYVVQSSLVGSAEWSEAVDVNCGAAAFFSPVDKGFPVKGVAAAGQFNQTQWVLADLDLEKAEHIRTQGQVFNFRDWPKQFNAELEVI